MTGARCTITACPGAATTHGLCLFHTHQNARTPQRVVHDHQETPVTTIAEHRATMPDDHIDHPTTNGTAAELVACPDCDKHVKPAGLGIHRAKAHGTYSDDRGNRSRRRRREQAREAPPEVEDKPEEPVVADTVDVAETIPYDFTTDQLDILDAIGFLNGMDRYDALTVIVDDGITQAGKSTAVRTLVKARREHRA